MDIVIEHPACGAGCCPAGECHDPYYLFAQWCAANGYAEIADDSAQHIDLSRLDAAIAAYAAACAT